MRRNVMISTAVTFTAIAATVLGSVTAASAASAAHVPTKLTGVPKAAIAVRAVAPTALKKGNGPIAVCVSGVPAAGTKPVRVARAAAEAGIAKGAIAVPASPLTGIAKSVRLTPTTVAAPAGVCTLVAASVPASLSKKDR